MINLDTIGVDWLIKSSKEITTEIIAKTPVEYAEEIRYLPAGVTSLPGLMSYDVNPYMREIVNCFSMDSPVREVNIMKGVQMTYTVAVLETVLLYFMGYLKIYPTMLISADKELVDQRIENNILVMLHQSGLGDIFQSLDEGNTRKTGKSSKKGLQWKGGGTMIPIGAKNSNKMRSHSVLLMLKDEIDAWAETVGNDGCPDELTNARCDAFSNRRKILRGSTPLEFETSKIRKAYLDGDQRKYFVVCRGCNWPQFIDWKYQAKNGERIFSFTWELDDGMLIPDSVSWNCCECNHKHYNDDKEILFKESEGAHWKPMARAVSPDIRSYHLPAFYSPVGMKSWSDCVTQFLKSYDVKTNKVVDVGKYQVFYNNILGMPFKVIAERVVFSQVSAHRRTCYTSKMVPNNYAAQWSGSDIIFLTCQVDVHKSNLAVAVMGWCVDSKCYTIEYIRMKADDATQQDDPVWAMLEAFIDGTYKDDTGRTYKILSTFIDARYSTDTVVKFCAKYASGVIPIMGQESPKKNAKFKEFQPFTTQVGTQGFLITVDIYKDRLAPVLRREWNEDAGQQRSYHFNAPMDITDRQLRELTNEYKREVINDRGVKSYEWKRRGDNEFWDLLVYGHAAVEIIAYLICIQHFELETIDWARFWEYMAEQLESN